MLVLYANVEGISPSVPIQFHSGSCRTPFLVFQQKWRIPISELLTCTTPTCWQAYYKVRVQNVINSYYIQSVSELFDNLISTATFYFLFIRHFWLFFNNFFHSIGTPAPLRFYKNNNTIVKKTGCLTRKNVLLLIKCYFKL